jgi:hypothetical protein
MSIDQKQKIAWQAPEFRYYEKNAGWYITVIAVTVLLVAYFIIIPGDYFAAV